jgi:glycosyltransferase involved in cell wall biosynthesis
MFKTMPNNSLGLNISGHIKGDFGLAEGVRSTVRAVESVGIPFVLNNLHLEGVPQTNNSYTNFSQDNPYPINLVQTNPDLITRVISENSNNLSSEYFQGHYNIGFWLWEMPHFPPQWEFAFDFFDEIWVMSGFSGEAISTVSTIPVVKIVPSLVLPAFTLGIESLNLPKDKFIFLFMFDFHSNYQRKNPLAVIESFKLAFEQSNHDIMLIIKFHNGEYYREYLEELNAAKANYPSIHLISKHLLKEEVNALVNSCDCYISLHRAEGFGLTMAEAMFYGKPVIATGYSSNVEFMNVGNSFLVKYDLVTTTEDYSPYPKGSIWAEPDINHAASLMNYVFHNYQQAKLVGARASQDIKYLLNPETVGQKIKNRLEYITENIINKKQRESQNPINAKEAAAWKQTAIQIQREISHLKS